jgi:hypothetical protein
VNPRRSLTLGSLILVSANLTACELAKGIFKAGIWVGILGVLGVLVLVALVAGMVRR